MKESREKRIYIIWLHLCKLKKNNRPTNLSRQKVRIVVAMQGWGYNLGGSMGEEAQWVAKNILNLDLGDGDTYVYTSTILRGWTQYLCTLCKLYLNKKIKELKSVQ